MFEGAERGEVTLHLSILPIAETVYVLMGRYGRARGEVVSALLALIQNAGIETLEEVAVTDALQRFVAVNVDFSDAWLAARAAQHGFPVASFDRDFDKFKDIKRFQPGW